MKTKLNLTAVLILLTLTLQSAVSQQSRISGESDNLHKIAVGKNKSAEAAEIENEMELTKNEHTEMHYITSTTGLTQMNEAPGGDWNTNDKLIMYDLIKPSIDSGKTIDMKIGEDNVMYAAINVYTNSFYKGNIQLYKSTDNGSTWGFIYGYLYTNYVGSISLLVESKDNSKPDSTRLIVLYTLSSNASMSDAALNFISIRNNGTAQLTGQISTPPAGRKFSHVSAISDGAFNASSTYIGVVCTESDNSGSFTSVTKTRYFRTVNWGSSWLSASLITGAADYFPSAGYKEGSSDTVCIAVERRYSDKVSLYMLKTSFVPNPVFSTDTVHNYTGYNFIYRKPCLAITQSSPAAEMIISYWRDYMPFYSKWTDNWDSHIFLQNIGNSFSVFTNCAAVNDGLFPFIAVCMTSDGDSVNVVKIPQNAGVVFTYKINSVNASAKTSPVIVLRPGSQKNLVNVAYAGTSVTQDSLKNAYCDFEGNKVLNFKSGLQGFYNNTENRLNSRDTVRIYVRRYSSPYELVDSGKAVMDSLTLTCTFNFSNLQDSYYYVVIKHRNSLETWTAPFYLRDAVTTRDITPAANYAFGNNMIKVDEAPVTYALYSGDVNQDGAVDLTDVLSVYNAASGFSSGYVVNDVTGNNIVDLTDILITYNNSAGFVAVVKP